MSCSSAKRSIRIFLPFLTSLQLALTSPAWSFDDDRSINEINLKEGNFLDINALQFRKPLELQWYDTLSGWRVSGGSLDADRLWLQTELQFQHSLSSKLNVRLEVQQEVFYAPKSLPNPLLEIELYPFKSDLGFSFLGTTFYDKRQSDLGAAVIWGRRPWDFVRFAWLDVDAYYNDKNDFDDSHYGEHPQTLKLHGAYRLTPQLKFRFLLEHDQPFTFYEAEQKGVFTYKNNRYDLTLDYAYKELGLMGVAIRGFKTNKSLRETEQYREQTMEFNSVEVYWLNRVYDDEYELTLGVQYDGIDSEIRTVSVPIESETYAMHTWQLYSVLYHEYSSHTAWDIGLYGGWEKEKHDFLTESKSEPRQSRFQGKLRTSFEYHSADKKNAMILHFSFNLDDLIDDPTDGGGISFQGSFWCPIPAYLQVKYAKPAKESNELNGASKRLLNKLAEWLI